MLHPCSTTLGSCLNGFCFLSRSPAARGCAASARLCPVAGCRQLRLKQRPVPVNSGLQKRVQLPETRRRGLLPLLAAMFPLPVPAHCHPSPWMHPYISSLRMRKAFFPPCADPPSRMPPQPTSVLEPWPGDQSGVGCLREPSCLARSRSPGSAGRSPGAGTPLCCPQHRSPDKPAVKGKTKLCPI